MPVHTPCACTVVPVHAANMGTGSRLPACSSPQHSQNGINSAHEISALVRTPPAVLRPALGPQHEKDVELLE